MSDYEEKTAYNEWRDSLGPEEQVAAQEWVDSRPSEVQDLIRRFPPSATVTIEGEVHYVMGYQEVEKSPPGLLLTPICPGADYEGAVAAKKFVCADHILMGVKCEHQRT